MFGKRRKTTIIQTSLGTRGKTREQKRVIKYFQTAGCLSRAMSDDEYDTLVATRLQAASNKEHALEVLGLDESQVQEIQPVCFHGYLYEDSKIEENNLILKKRGNDDEWRSSAYMVSWIFFGDHEVYFYQEVFCMDSLDGWVSTDVYFYDDIVTMFVDWVKVVYGAATLEENLAFRYPCAAAERRHPDYARACEAGLAALKAGDRNFPGIGLPPDLARMP